MLTPSVNSAGTIQMAGGRAVWDASPLRPSCRTFSKERVGLQRELALGCFDGWSGSLGSSDHQRWLRW